MQNLYFFAVWTLHLSLRQQKKKLFKQGIQFLHFSQAIIKVIPKAEDEL